MRKYNYELIYRELLQPDIVSLLSQIHEYKGEQTLFIEEKSDTLVQLAEAAKIQSTEASNKIEGIYTSDDRLKKLVQDKTRPKTRSEKEIAGYRDVLNTIHENYDYIPVKSTAILQLHRELCKFSGGSGGIFKDTDNVIAEGDAQGNKTICFQPVPAWETMEHVEAICNAFDEACKNKNCDPLLLIPMFILDFFCVQPFNGGNGRMSRLLTLLLLYRAGYIVGKYISIEKLIDQTKESYYEALQESLADWHEENNDYVPFVRYVLGIVIAAYREFSSRVQVLLTSGFSKPERIREIMKKTQDKVTKAELMKKCPDISQTTIQRTLNDLVKNGEILKIGGGRYTAYVWHREDN